MSGNTNEIADAGEGPGKSSLFFLTYLIDHGIELLGDMVYWLVKQSYCGLSGALSTALEKAMA